MLLSFVEHLNRIDDNTKGWWQINPFNGNEIHHHLLVHHYLRPLRERQRLI